MVEIVVTCTRLNYFKVRKQFILFWIISIIYPLQAQESVRLIVAFESEKTYDFNSYTKTTSTIDFSGNDRFVNSLKSQGVTLPIKNENESEEHNTIYTEKRKKEKLPFYIDLVEAKRKDQIEGQQAEESIESNRKKYIKGNIEEGTIKVSRFRGVDLKKINETINEIVTQHLLGDQFPAHELHVNELFTTNSNTIFTPNKDIAIQSTTDKTYQITKIENNKVYLEYESTTTSTVATLPYKNAEVKGKGTGKLIYNISTQLIEHKESNEQLTLRFEAKEGIITQSENQVYYKQEIHLKN